jgi:hypothetical protein
MILQKYFNFLNLPRSILKVVKLQAACIIFRSLHRFKGQPERHGAREKGKKKNKVDGELAEQIPPGFHDR